jgi:Flp pilus assembly protein TadB
MTTSGTGWPRGRTTWILGTVLLFAGGVLVGILLGNVWVGLLIAAAVSIGWVIAYESWRGRNVGVYDRDDNGAQL